MDQRRVFLPYEYITTSNLQSYWLCYFYYNMGKTSTKYELPSTRRIKTLCPALLNIKVKIGVQMKLFLPLKLQLLMLVVQKIKECKA